MRMIYPRAAYLGLVLCRRCGQTNRSADADEGGGCIRCAYELRSRIPASREKTLAWLITGLILYVPANLLPVLHTHGIRGAQDSTIIGGIAEFWRAGSWDIAAIIFVASVGVPMTKFLALGLLLWSVRWRSTWARRERTRLYQFVEIIGYWSMLDVVVVGITCALVKIGALETAEPRAGIVFFCLVVIATMLAAMSFDPRLIWDTHGAEHTGCSDSA